jgi:aspartate/methionine/tyrosine aminotransferase
VTVDGKSIGTSPFVSPLALPPGDHIVVFSNPGYVSMRKTAAIVSGHVTRLEMDFAFEGFPK